MREQRLDVSEGFDVHEYRHELKLLEQGKGTMQLTNRQGLRCPTCEEPFDRLLVTEKRHHTFSAPSGPFCLARTDERLLVLTH
jgi:hypothetical protein